jgi:hypothetical protein
MVTWPLGFTSVRTQKRSSKIVVQPDPEPSAFEEMLVDDHTARKTF